MKKLLLTLFAFILACQATLAQSYTFTQLQDIQQGNLAGIQLSAIVQNFSPTNTTSSATFRSIASFAGDAAMVSDGNNLWGIDQTAGGSFNIVKITPGGGQTEFALPHNPGPMCLGSDTRIWMCAGSGAAVLMAVDQTGVITNYAVPFAGGAISVVTGGDGNLYVYGLLAGVPKIAQISTSGTVLNTFTPSASLGAAPVLMPDGRIWYTVQIANTIEAMDVSGVVTTYTPTGYSSAGLMVFTAGGDGNIYAVEQGTNGVQQIIYQISTAGVVLRTFGFVTPYTGAETNTWQGAVWFNNNLWLTEVSSNKIMVLNPVTGVAQDFGTAKLYHPISLITGPDNALWGITNGGFSNINITATWFRFLPTGSITTTVVDQTSNAVLLQGQNSNNTNGNGAAMTVDGFSTVLLTLQQGGFGTGFGGVVNFEASVDGVLWTAINGQQIGTANSSSTFTGSGVGAGNGGYGDWQINVVGYRFLRTRISSYTTGSVTIRGFGSPLSSIASNATVNLSQVNGGAVPTGHGTASGALRVELPTDGTGIIGAGIATTSNTTMQSAAVGNGNGTVLSTAGYATVVLNLTGSMSGGTTVNFEVSPDGGATWLPCLGTQVGTTTAVTSTTALGSWQFNVTGYNQMRARISAFSAGTLTVIGYVSPLAYRGPPVTLASLGMNTFVSADQAVSTAATFSIAHGLGRKPVEMWYAFVCQVAQSNYSIGDVVTGYPGNNASSTATGVQMWADNTNVNAVLGSGAIACILNKTTGAGLNITAADWKIRFYAR